MYEMIQGDMKEGDYEPSDAHQKILDDRIALLLEKIFLGHLKKFP